MTATLLLLAALFAALIAAAQFLAARERAGALDQPSTADADAVFADYDDYREWSEQELTNYMDEQAIIEKAAQFSTQMEHAAVTANTHPLLADELVPYADTRLAQDKLRFPNRPLVPTTIAVFDGS